LSDLSPCLFPATCFFWAGLLPVLPVPFYEFKAHAHPPLCVRLFNIISLFACIFYCKSVSGPDLVSPSAISSPLYAIFSAYPDYPLAIELSVSCHSYIYFFSCGSPGPFRLFRTIVSSFPSLIFLTLPFQDLATSNLCHIVDVTALRGRPSIIFRLSL